MSKNKQLHIQVSQGDREVASTGVQTDVVIVWTERELAQAVDQAFHDISPEDFSRDTFVSRLWTALRT